MVDINDVATIQWLMLTLVSQFRSLPPKAEIVAHTMVGRTNAAPTVSAAEERGLLGLKECIIFAPACGKAIDAPAAAGVGGLRTALPRRVEAAGPEQSRPLSPRRHLHARSEKTSPVSDNKRGNKNNEHGRPST